MGVFGGSTKTRCLQGCLGFKREGYKRWETGQAEATARTTATATALTAEAQRALRTAGGIGGRFWLVELGFWWYE